MPHHVETDISVQRFGFTGDDSGQRLQFPRAESHKVEGRSGSVSYGAADLLFDALEGRLDTFRWTAEAASIGDAWLRDDTQRFDLAVGRLELPRGIRLVRAERGVEIMAPHASLSEIKVNVKGPFGRSDKLAKPAKPAPAAEPAPIAKPAPTEEPSERESKLRFLDSLSGRIFVTIKVRLDLPVLGVRTLDQQLKVPIQEGSIDFRALENSLDWLEGKVLDIAHDGDKLAVTWKVPIFGRAHDLIAWTLDRDSSALAAFGRVMVRSLADYRFDTGAKPVERGHRDGTGTAPLIDGIATARNRGGSGWHSRG